MTDLGLPLGRCKNRSLGKGNMRTSRATNVSAQYGTTVFQLGDAHRILILLIALSGAACTQVDLENRTFFRQEYGLDTHGRKTWFDHMVEVDPGGIDAKITSDYDEVAPARIAVLPFVDHGSAQYLVDKVPLTARSKEEQANWAWTDSNRMRRAIHGYLSQREFVAINLIQVDQVMKEHGITDETALMRVPPEQLGEWLGVDGVVYGEVTHHEAYYGGLISAWQVGAKIRMVSTRDGQELYSADGDRYSVDIRPAIGLIDIGINSGLTLLQLRDMNLVRAEEDNAREIVLRIPRSERLQNQLIDALREKPGVMAQDATAQSAPAAEAVPEQTPESEQPASEQSTKVIAPRWFVN